MLGSALISASPALAQSPPDAVASVSLTRSDGTLTASWDAPSGATKYHVTYTVDGVHNWVSAADNHSGTSITITSVDNHATYVVGVRAGNANDQWSTWTNSAPIAPQVPAAPVTVGLTRAAGQLTVTWSAVPGVTSYNINISGDGTNSWTRAASANAPATSATIDTGVENWRWYIAAVQAVNDKGGGGWTNSEFVAPIYSPGPVGNLTATRSGTGISVTWDAPADNGGSAVTGYDVNYTVDGVHSWTRYASNQSGTSATIANVSNAVAYVVAVRARNGVGDGGAWTNSALVLGLAGPATVTAVKGGDYVEGVWDAVAGATGYDVNLLYFQNQYHYRIETNMSGTSRRVYINDGGSFSPEQFVIAVRARNEHGPGAWVNSPPATSALADYDADDDGLIEVSNLAQLNAMRYDLDGDGAASSGNTTAYATAFPNAKANMGCGSNTCSGYELAADLDFDTNGNGSADSGDTYWNSGAGWTPIGASTTTYTGDFDGNSDTDSSGDGGPYTIANLFINLSSTSGTSYAGLFGVIGSGAEVKNVALTGVSVTASTTGEAAYAGALAGRNRGTVTGSYSLGAVTANHTGSGLAVKKAYAGGLAGQNSGTIRRSYSRAAATATAHNANTGYAGGLAALNDSGATIAGSFARGSVTANRGTGTGIVLNSSYTGGLVADNEGTITASYAAGDGTAAGRNLDMGGLVGTNSSSATITASFSTGSLSGTATGGTATIGGLIAVNGPAATVTDSYWDTTASNQSSSAAGTGKTTTELQSPTGYTGIYANWNVNVDGVTGNDDPWDFGTTSQYPILTHLPSSEQGR